MQAIQTYPVEHSLVSGQNDVTHSLDGYRNAQEPGYVINEVNVTLICGRSLEFLYELSYLNQCGKACLNLSPMPPLRIFVQTLV
jgi:hypothetical protein